jgi:hypothetical protein
VSAFRSFTPSLNVSSRIHALTTKLESFRRRTESNEWNPHLLLSLSAPHANKKVTSDENSYAFTVSGAVQDTPLGPHLFSADESVFPVTAGKDASDVLLQDVPMFPLVTILSPLKLVKTPVSWSSQT